MLSAKILRNLKDIGLTEKEAGVYLAALSLGPATIVKLSEATVRSDRP